MRWTDEAGQQDLKDFTIAVSAVPSWVAEQWWRTNRDNFSRMFRLFVQGMEGDFAFADCDPVADFAQRAVLATQDMEILREAIRGLALLGFHHDRWHVRDLATWILQWIRIDAYAATALEGLQAAGTQAAEWTTAYTVPGALHPILSAGISQMRQSPPAHLLEFGRQGLTWLVTRGGPILVDLPAEELSSTDLVRRGWVLRWWGRRGRAGRVRVLGGCVRCCRA